MSLDQPISASDESPNPNKGLLTRLLHPVVAIPIIVIAILVALPFIIRAARVAGIPDIGDPFDVEKHGHVDIAPKDNAYVDYAAVATLVIDVPSGEIASHSDTLEHGWESASEGLKKWLTSNEAALARWRVGAAKPDAVNRQPRDLQIDTDLMPDVNALRAIARVALVEGKRLEAEGKFDEAWNTYRALFRTTRHAGKHGAPFERLFATALHSMVANAIVTWSRRSEVSTEMLEEALRAIEADDAMTAPASRPLKTEYVVVDNALRRADLVHVAGKIGGPMNTTLAESGLFALNERLMCRLILQQTFANILEHCDKPLADRPPRHYVGHGLYQPMTGSTPDPKRLDAEAIARMHRKSILARLFIPPMESYLKSLDRERGRQTTLRTALALQILRRKYGVFPADLDALVESKLCDEVPIDPLSSAGYRLRYRKDAERVVVWSVGENGVDDGGLVDDSNLSDIGYILPARDAQ